MNENEQWVLLWNCDTNSMHVQPLEHLLSCNRLAYCEAAKLSPYHPIYIGCKKAVEQAADSVRGTLKARRSITEAA